MDLSYKIITDVATEPITLAEAKAQTRVLSDNDDAFISALISTAREYAESVHGRIYGTKTVEVVSDHVDGVFNLPFKAESVTINSAKYTDSEGEEHDFGNYCVADEYRSLIVSSLPPTNNLAEINPVVFNLTAGGNPSKPTKQAMLLLIGHWYENREDTQAGGLVSIPMGAKTLLDLERHEVM